MLPGGDGDGKKDEERVDEVEGRTRALDEYNKHTTGTIAQVSRSIEGLCAKLGANTTLLQEMGAEGGANESNLMVYLGVLEQRANELLSGYLSLSGGGGHSGRYDEPGTPGGSGLLVGPHTPQGVGAVSIAVPTTADEFESEDESEEEEEHPLSREDLVSKTMRGLAKRETNAKGPMRSKGRKAPR